MINVAIVEDEAAEAKKLTEALKRYERESKMPCAFDIKVFGDACLFLTNYKPVYNIVFMDIKLPGMDGMEAARRMRKFDEHVNLIFTTTMAQFAIKGYEVNAVDYFVKPYDYYDLKMRLDRIMRSLAEREAFMSIPIAGGVKSVRCSDVYYIETSGHTLIYHTVDGVTETRGAAIRNLEEQLTHNGFARCNSCYLVNLAHCTVVIGNTVTVGGDNLAISRGKKQEFMSRFTAFLQGQGGGNP